MKRTLQTLALAASLLAVSTVAAPFANATTPGTVEPKEPVAVEAANSFSVYAKLSGNRNELRFFVQKSTAAPVWIELKNADGEVLYTSALGKRCNGKALVLNVSELPDGQYTVEVSNRDKKDVKSFVLQTPAPTRSVVVR
jgi:flagellar hook assembly protein FlgD